MRVMRAIRSVWVIPVVQPLSLLMRTTMMMTTVRKRTMRLPAILSSVARRHGIRPTYIFDLVITVYAIPALSVRVRGRAGRVVQVEMRRSCRQTLSGRDRVRPLAMAMARLGRIGVVHARTGIDVGREGVEIRVRVRFMRGLRVRGMEGGAHECDVQVRDVRCVRCEV